MHVGYFTEILGIINGFKMYHFCYVFLTLICLCMFLMNIRKEAFFVRRLELHCPCLTTITCLILKLMTVRKNMLTLSLH